MAWWPPEMPASGAIICMYIPGVCFWNVSTCPSGKLLPVLQTHNHASSVKPFQVWILNKTRPGSLVPKDLPFFHSPCDTGCHCQVCVSYHHHRQPHRTLSEGKAVFSTTLHPLDLATYLAYCWVIATIVSLKKMSQIFQHGAHVTSYSLKEIWTLSLF